MNDNTNFKSSYFKEKYNILLIGLICILSFFLNFYAISNYGYGNEYYAAAISSMTKSFKNFFFVSFDPSGMVSVDKPPLGLWMQAISVLIFGYKGWALMLPQALAGTASCLMIYILVKKYFAKIPALLSSFIFAITPIVVAVSRNNTIDMQLIFVLLSATWFLFKSIDKNKIIYLIIAGILIGLGFNIKMLQAYMVLPAFAIVYLIFSKQKFSKRIVTGIITTIIMLAVSLSWSIVVALYPSSQRPYVDSTSNNSIFDLIVGHNGTERILGRDNMNSMPNQKGPEDKDKNNPGNMPNNNENNPAPNKAHGNNPNDDYIGTASPIRLWIQSIYGQISWLIIMAMASIIACAHRFKIKNSTMKDAVFIFWEIWFFTMLIFFSFAGFYHRYYLCMIAPSIAILCGIGIPKMLKDFKEKSSWKQFLLPIGFILTMILEINHITKYDELPAFIVPLVSAATLLCIVFMILYYFKNTQRRYRIHIIAASLLIATLTAPFYWALTPVIYVPSLVKPSAGPDIGTNDSKNINASMKGGSKSSDEDFQLEQYLLSHYKKGSFLVVASRSNDIAKFIIDTGLPAYAYGGFSGNDNSLSLDKLKEYVAEGKITYFLVSNVGMNSNSEIIDFVKEHAALIDKSEYSNNFSNDIKGNQKSKDLYCFNDSIK